MMGCVLYVLVAFFVHFLALNDQNMEFSHPVAGYVFALFWPVWLFIYLCVILWTGAGYVLHRLGAVHPPDDES